MKNVVHCKLQVKNKNRLNYAYKCHKLVNKSYKLVKKIVIKQVYFCHISL